MTAWIIILLILLFVVVAIVGQIAARKRREALEGLAAKLGLAFREGRDFAFAAQYKFLDRLNQGENRYAYNILSGEYRGYPVQAGDYHFETHSTDSKGHRTTHNHYLSFFIVSLPRTLPELTISREGLFSKIAQAFGYEDIDFESAEFSRRFCVRSKDKKFAYDVCNARLIEYLLANDDLAIEIERDVLAVIMESTLQVDRIEGNLDRLIDVRSRLPEYLFNT